MFTTTTATVAAALWLAAAPAAWGPFPAQEPVSFPTRDDGVVHADAYGDGSHGVILVHGARFDKSSWERQARALAEAGFRVLSIDLRGYGESLGGAGSVSSDGYDLDVLAAVRYLQDSGTTRVSVIGGSLGGWAAARAAVAAEPGEIDGLVLLAHSPIEQPEAMQGRKLFVTTRHDSRGGGTRRLPEIRDQYDKATGPKELLVLDGSAHAQFIFETKQGEGLMAAILQFLADDPGSGDRDPDDCGRPDDGGPDDQEPEWQRGQGEER